MDKEIIKLLKDIRKLTILDLIERGVKANAIANILGVTKGTLSLLVPARKVGGKNKYGKKVKAKNSPKTRSKNR